MRYYLNGSSISNDRFFGNRIFAISERAYVLVPHLTINQIYGFNKINISEFKRNPITSEEFWFEGYTGPAIAERTWDYINQMYISYQSFGIRYFVENTRTNGDVLWHHGMYPSELLHHAYEEKDNVYNNGKVNMEVIMSHGNRLKCKMPIANAIYLMVNLSAHANNYLGDSLECL